MSKSKSNDATAQVILAAIYDDETGAQQAIKRLSDAGAPLDMLSVLGRVHASGDDVLGVEYDGAGSRVEAWAKQGAAWGALWGLLAGAAVVVLPGVGPVLAAGPAVEAIAAVLAGSAMGGAAMAGAAALTHVATLMHRMGIPRPELDHLHQAIEGGKFVLVLREADDQAQPWLDLLRRSAASEVFKLPYRGTFGLSSPSS